MKKNIVQDVVPPKKSIRNVKMPPKKGVDHEVYNSSTKEEPANRISRHDDFSRSVPLQVPMRIEPQLKNSGLESSENTSYKYEFNDNKKSSKKWVYILSFIFLILIAFGISALFKSANIKISPKQEARAINNNFVAKKDAAVGLGFQTVTVSKDVEKTVKSTGEEKVDKKSRGRIVIYNNFNNQIQKLVAATRFQTPEGLIFRLVNPVAIPGTTVKDGKTIPGSIEVVVEADKSGISYNIPLKDFTIPGFKGDPKYTTIFARSKTEMSGGFSGLQKVVSKEVLLETEKELTPSLESILLKDIEAQIPANYISYKDSLFYELESISQAESTTEGEVIIRKKGKATSIIFDKSVLTKSILSAVMPEIESESVKISNISELTFKSSNTLDEVNSSINFSLDGTANFIWVVDENGLKNNLLGLSKKSAMTVISKYPAINEAWIETRPFWNQKIPTNPDKVVLINTVSPL